MKTIQSRTKHQILLGSMLLLLIGCSQVSEDPSMRSMSRDKVWRTANPELAKDFTSIKLTGKVKSNKFAIVAPRRTGIIQDLLVDIGDAVSKGQTIGYLFPEGVEGQGSASIATAAAQLAKARAELGDARGVANEAVSLAEKGLSETKTKLGNLQDNSQTGRTQIQQKYDEAKTIATQSFENLKRILFGSTNLNNSVRNVLGSFGNTIQENTVENMVDEVERMEKSGLYGQREIYDHLSHVTNLLNTSESLYKSARESGNFSQAVIEKNLKAIQNEQIRILRAKENLDDVVLQARELASTVEKSQESLNLVSSQQNFVITQASNAVEVARANYNAALVKAGHQKIIAPFSGTVSARMVEVGQAVTPNTVLFYMEDVETNRSGAEIFEVHLAIPESWAGKVSVGDNVELQRSGTSETLQGRIFRLSDQINLRTGMMMATVAVMPPMVEIPQENKEEEDEGDEVSNEPEVVLAPKDINLIHGQTIFVSLKDQNASLFSVPTLSLKKRGTEYYLWKMNTEIPVKLRVEVLAEDGEFSQIHTTELTTEDSIITNPSVSLFKESK